MSLHCIAETYALRIPELLSYYEIGLEQIILQSCLYDRQASNYSVVKITG